MELNNDLIAAINYACEKAGSQSAFADLVGTKRQNLSRYLNKEVKDITPKIMARLWPHIREFMPKDFAFPPNFGSETSAEILSNHQETHPENNYSIYRLMLKSLYDIGADQLLFHILIYWEGFDEEKKKKAYAQIYKIAENIIEEGE